jgi:hypothetical protein
MTPIIACIRILTVCLLVLACTGNAYGADTWLHWARSVGQAESDRAVAIKHLRLEKNLQEKLLAALETKDRSLALDVMSALELKKMIPELLTRVETDKDGFLTLTINSLLDSGNQTSILASYQTRLRAESFEKNTAAVIVAMLEPIGRLGVVLPPESMELIFSHAYPEVRAAGLYYLREMAMTHHQRINESMLKGLLKAKEFQVRLQTVAVLTELLNLPESSLHTTSKELFAQCESEANEKIKDSCLSLLKKRGSAI